MSWHTVVRRLVPALVGALLAILGDAGLLDGALTASVVGALP